MAGIDTGILAVLALWALWFAWWIWYQATGRMDADAKRVADWLTRKVLGGDE